jgi:hypothetical protein
MPVCQIYFPQDIFARVSKDAAEAGVSMSKIATRGMRAYYDMPALKSPSRPDVKPDFKGDDIAQFMEYARQFQTAPPEESHNEQMASQDDD